MNGRKWLSIAAALLIMAVILAGCNSSGSDVKQIASAKQIYGDDQVAIMTVDLSGGYSVEFASGAAYFYKGEPSEDVAAFGYIITKEEYDEEIAYLTENDEISNEVSDLGDGIYSYDGAYYFPADDGLFIKVAVQENAMDDADSIYTRFTAHKDE